jgi:hypothetical protein
MGPKAPGVEGAPDTIANDARLPQRRTVPGVLSDSSSVFSVAETRPGLHDK